MMKRAVCLILSVLLFASLFAGCGESKRDDEARKFVGTYTMSYHSNVVLTIKSNKTYVYKFNGETTESGTWTCSGDTITLKSKNGGSTVGVRDGNKLYFGGRAFVKEH